VGNLQVKNLPDDVHQKLRERARKEHRTVSDLVTQVLRREVSRPSLAEWLADLDKLPRRDTDVDMDALMDEIRGPWPDEADADR
jgi:antitoxin FitA